MSAQSPTDGLDVLAIGAHPDDVELFCGGTLALLASKGRRTGLLSLTRGECGTRGTPEIREKESSAAAEILGLAWQRTLDLGDGQLADGDAQRRAVVAVIRQTRPSVIIAHGIEDRHPDHTAANALARSASFLANVGGYNTSGERHEIGALVFFQGHERRVLPAADWIVDISAVYERKLAGLRAYGTQFVAPADDSEPATYISSRGFWKRMEATARRFGALIGSEYGEGFNFQTPAHRDHPFVRLFDRD